MVRIRQAVVLILLGLLVAGKVWAADPLAARIRTNTTDFDNNLSAADDNVQKALNTLDEIAAGGGSGDVTGVGDCADGACLDGSSDGGTNISLYDGDSNKFTIQGQNVAADVVITLPATSGTLIHTEADTLDSVFDRGNDITQSSFDSLNWAFSEVAGTEDVPLIFIDDDRTGTTVDEVGEASLVIDAEGSYGLYVLDGNIDFSSATAFYIRGASYFTNATNSVNTDVGFGWGGTTMRFAGKYDSNSTADSLMVFNTFSDDDEISCIMLARDLNPNGDTSSDDYLSPTLKIVNDEGADANDYSAVVIGERAQSNVATTHYFDFYAMTGAADGSVNATTTEIPAMFRFGDSGSATSGHSLSSGDVLFEDDVEVNGVLYADGGISTYNGATGAGFLDIYEDSDDGTNYTRIQVPAMAGNITYTLPSDDGDASEFLQTNGSGTLTWAAVAGGGDMLKATYDADTDNIVDNSEAVEGTDLGTLTNTKYCTYDETGTEIDCNSDAIADCYAVNNCETDPNVDTSAEILAIIGADAINDTYIDWGTGANQVNPADFADQDIGDITITTGAWAVEDNSHAHTTTTISGLDISADTNLTAGDALTLNDDDIDFDGGASPGGELGGTWASPTVDSGIHDDEYADIDGDTYTGTHNFGGATIEIANTNADAVLANAGEIHFNTADEQLSIHSGADGEVSGEVSISVIRHLSVPMDLAGWYDQESTYRVYPLFKVGDDSPEGITITEWRMKCVEGDPTTELDCDLMCDTTPDFNPAAGATVMDVLDTTAGASTADTGFDSATCANGAEVYLRMGADPTDANRVFMFDLWFVNEED